MNKTLSLVVSLFAGVLIGSGSGLYWLIHQAESRFHRREARLAEEVEKARPPAPWDFWTLEIDELARELAQRRESLEQREQDLVVNEARLRGEAKELENLRREIETMRRDFDARLTVIQSTEQRNLRNLAATYSLLAPPAAVAIFNELDDATVTKLLSLMKAENAATLLAALSAQPGGQGQHVRRAAAISERLRLIHTEAESP